MTTTYRTFRTLTMIGALGVAGSIGYGVSEGKKIGRTDQPELVRVAEINSELKDISSILDSLPVRVVSENPDSIQRYVRINQREESLREEYDSLSALPVVQQAQTENWLHFRNIMFYGLGGVFLFSCLGAISGAKWSMKRVREYEDSQGE